MHWIAFFLLLIFNFSLVADVQQNKSGAKYVLQTEERFGVTIEDPYKWMENGHDPYLGQWIHDTRDESLSYVADDLFHEVYNEFKELYQPSEKIYHDHFLNNFDQLQELKQIRGIPFTSLQDQISLLNRDIKTDGQKYKLEFVNETGSDYKRIEIYDAQSKKRIDVLHVKFVRIFFWDSENSFIYGSDNDGRTVDTHYVIYRHVVGQHQADDEVLYRAPSPFAGAGLVKFNDENIFLFRSTGKDWSTEISRFDITTKKLTDSLAFTGRFTFSDFIDSDPVVYYKSFENAPYGEFFAVNLNSKKIIPIFKQQDFILVTVKKILDEYLVVGLKDTTHVLYRLDLSSGKLIEIDLPLAGYAHISSANGKILVSLSNFTSPWRTFTLDLASNSLNPIGDSVATPFPIKSERIYYTAHNGKQVGIWICYKADTELTPKTPLYLNGYGGFSVNEIPSYNKAYLPWLKRGGVYAIAILPGGMEYGKEWHQAGSLFNKENTFHDFARAAKALIAQGISSSEKMAIGGVSNGGLLVSATLQLYPTLFAAAVPEVGVHDLLNYHLFTSGKHWMDEYGNPDDPAMFSFLRKISPYHNLTLGNYPATLVMTATHDDRVVPSHSYKYAAKLKDMQQATDPILLYTSFWGGHGGPSSRGGEGLKYRSMKWSFLIKELMD